MARRDYEAESIVEQFGRLRADYDAAKKTRFKRQRTGIVPTGSGADYHYRTWQSYAAILETARDLFRNHVLIGQGVRRLVANILRGGFTLDVKTGDETLDEELVGRWYEWADDPICDIQGEQNFHGLETFVLQQTVVDGDVLTLPTRDGHLQLVESHRLRTPTNTTRNVVHGVLARTSTAAGRSTGSPRTISARLPRCRSWAKSPATRPGRRRADRPRGAPGPASLHARPGEPDPRPDGAGAGGRYGRDGRRPDVRPAREGPDGGLRHDPAGTGGRRHDASGAGRDRPGALRPSTRPTGTTRQIAGWQPGMELFGFPGETLKGFSPNVPNAEFFAHAKLILTILASNLDLPLAVLLLDPSETNFSGWRGAMDQARQRFQTIQRWLIDSFHTPVYRWKVRQWAASDPAIRKALEATVKTGGLKGINVFGHVWHAQEWPYIEPTQDALGDVIQERNLLISPRRRAARRGIDYDDLVSEIMEDREQVITKAHVTATKLNTLHGLALTWKDIAHWPMPEGVSISLSNAPQQQPNGKPAAKPEPENTRPFTPLARKDERPCPQLACSASRTWTSGSACGRWTKAASGPAMSCCATSTCTCIWRAAPSKPPSSRPPAESSSSSAAAWR
jgi:capsid protein